MKLGIHIGYWGLGLTAEEQLALVLEAERLGYDSVWTAEAYGSDAATILGWLAQATERIKLGSAIFQMPGRSPAMTAMTAATLDQLSGGRHAARHRLERAAGRPRAGTASASASSCSGRASTSRWCGWRWRASGSSSTGETLTLPLPDGPGKALKLTIAPVQERIPIYLAAIGPKNTTLAAEIADGWLPTLFSPEHVDEFRPLLEEGFARAGGGKGFDDFDIAPSMQRVRHRRPRRRARRDAPVRRALRRRHGLARAELLQRARAAATGSRTPRARVQDLYLEGKQRRGGGGAAGRADRHRLAVRAARRGARAARRSCRDAGVGTLMVSPMAWTFEDRREQLRQVAELAA